MIIVQEEGRMKRWAAAAVEEVVPILLLIMKMVVSDTMIVTIHEIVEHKIVIIHKTEEEMDTMIVTTQEEMIEAEMITNKMITQLIIMKMRTCRQSSSPLLQDTAGRLVVGQEDHNITIHTTVEIHMIGIVGIRITYEEGKAM